MLRFFAKQSEISKKDIREFSKEYNLVQGITQNSPASLSHNSVGIAEQRTDDAQIASMGLHAAPVDAQDGGVSIIKSQCGFSMIVIAALFTAFATLMAVTLDHQTLYAPMQETARNFDNRADAALALGKYATDHKTLPAPVDYVDVSPQIIKGKLPDLSAYDANLTTKGITYSVNRNLLVASGVASERLPFDGDYALEIKDAKPLYVRLSDTDYQLPVLHQESDGHGGWVFKADK